MKNKKLALKFGLFYCDLQWGSATDSNGIYIIGVGGLVCYLTH